VPTSREWARLKDEEFRDYLVRVHGLVENPVELSLQDLREMGRRDQITMHNCIQGWSAIGKWSGLPFTSLIELVKPSPEAQWVMFYSYGEGGAGRQYYDSHSIKDLGHNQSLLAYEMNGEPLPVLHGAPLPCEWRTGSASSRSSDSRGSSSSATSPSAARARTATTRTASSSATAMRSDARGVSLRGWAG
jgi:DMSO/TMAO reductase YedYZ molybdopterin-dependent catalytic subunit